jgi:hypothetical protein
MSQIRLLDRLRNAIRVRQYSLDTDMAWIDDVVRAKPTRRVPVVLSQDEVSRLLSKMPPTQLLH